MAVDGSTLQADGCNCIEEGWFVCSIFGGEMGDWANGYRSMVSPLEALESVWKGGCCGATRRLRKCEESRGASGTLLVKQLVKSKLLPRCSALLRRMPSSNQLAS
jgi:hypothetical protein